MRCYINLLKLTTIRGSVFFFFRPCINVIITFTNCSKKKLAALFTQNSEQIIKEIVLSIEFGTDSRSNTSVNQPRGFLEDEGNRRSEQFQTFLWRITKGRRCTNLLRNMI